MSESQKKILEMLAQKKISVDEAYRLLELLQPETGTGTKEPKEPKESKSSAKYLRVEIKSSAEGSPAGVPEHVNVKVPMSLIRAGVKLSSIIPPSAYNRVDEALKEKGIEFDLRNMKPEDIEELVTALSDLEVDIQNGKASVQVHVE
jgi:hypothetical protein